MIQPDFQTVAQENIRKLLAAMNVSSYDVSTRLGKNRTYLDDFLRGRKKSLSSDFAYKLAIYFGVASEYIAGRKTTPENIFKSQFFNPYEEKLSMDFSSPKTLLDTLIQRMRLDQKDEVFYGLSARLFAELDAQSDEIDRLDRKIVLLEDELQAKGGKALKHWNFPPEFLTKYDIRSQEDIVIYLCNDRSMVDLNGGGYLQGDYIVIDTRKISLMSGGAFAVSVDGEVILRMVSVATSGSDKNLKLSCLNPKFLPIERLSHSVQVIGRAVAHIEPA